MSWIQKLYETYECCFSNKAIPDSGDLFPIAHTTQQAHVEVTLDVAGKFIGAKVLANKNDQKTLIPCTEQSCGRSGKKPENHPLCDKLQYVARDFVDWGGEVTIGYAKDPEEPFRKFCESLGNWCSSPYSHEMTSAILTYVKTNDLIEDLLRSGVLYKDEQSQKCIQLEWKGDKGKEPLIFKALPPGQTPMDAFIRFRVRSSEEMETGTWESLSLVQRWIDFYTNRPQLSGLCYVVGDGEALAEQHPAKLRNDADKAKLISSNDTSGFTFRGRFTDAAQVVGVSFAVTQKAHNALRWLIRRKQAFRNDTQTFVSWAVKGKEIPALCANSLEFLGDQEESDLEESLAIGDVGQTFARRLNKKLAGYRANIDDSDDIVVMGLDSATPGRMAITYYRELRGSDFLHRIEQWHSDFAWYQFYRKEYQFFGAPAPKDIAWAVFGKKVEGKNGSKLLSATVERILPCIVDSTPLPNDLVVSSVRRASNRMGLEHWEWEKCLGIACALFRGTHKEGRYGMALDVERKSRDYLYGRLLAVADQIESTALYLSGESRETTAARLMQRFSDRPYSTWRTIETALVPYQARIKSKRPGLHVGYNELLDDIHHAFSSTDFSHDNRLSGEYLLGYHCQRKWLRDHKRKDGQWVLKTTDEPDIQVSDAEEEK